MKKKKPSQEELKVYCESGRNCERCKFDDCIYVGITEMDYGIEQAFDEAIRDNLFCSDTRRTNSSETISEKRTRSEASKAHRKSYNRNYYTKNKKIYKERAIRRYRRLHEKGIGNESI